jgi:hypothetical protein
VRIALLGEDPDNQPERVQGRAPSSRLSECTMKLSATFAVVEKLRRQAFRGSDAYKYSAQSQRKKSNLTVL